MLHGGHLVNTHLFNVNPHHFHAGHYLLNPHCLDASQWTLSKSTPLQCNHRTGGCKRSGDLLNEASKWWDLHRSGGDLLNVHGEESEWWGFTSEGDLLNVHCEVLKWWGFMSKRWGFISKRWGFTKCPQ